MSEAPRRPRGRRERHGRDTESVRGERARRQTRAVFNCWRTSCCLVPRRGGVACKEGAPHRILLEHHHATQFFSSTTTRPPVGPTHTHTPGRAPAWPGGLSALAGVGQVAATADLRDGNQKHSGARQAWTASAARRVAVLGSPHLIVRSPTTSPPGPTNIHHIPSHRQLARQMHWIAS